MKKTFNFKVKYQLNRLFRKHLIILKKCKHCTRYGKYAVLIAFFHQRKTNLMGKFVSVKRVGENERCPNEIGLHSVAQKRSSFFDLNFIESFSVVAVFASFYFHWHNTPGICLH